MKKMSRQLRWQHAQLKLGKCRQCGRKKEPHYSTCPACRKAAAKKYAERAA